MNNKAEAFRDKLADIIDDKLGYTNGWSIPLDDYEKDCKECADEILTLCAEVARDSVKWIKPEFADHKECLIFKSKAIEAINKAFGVSDE